MEHVKPNVLKALSLLREMDINNKMIDAMQLSRAYNKAYDTSIDHHEFIYILDQAATLHVITCSQGWGVCQYIWNWDQKRK